MKELLAPGLTRRYAVYDVGDVFVVDIVGGTRRGVFLSGGRDERP
jgi:hypothetical protein